MSTSPDTTTFAALGTTATVSVVDRHHLAGAVAMVRSCIDELDAAASRFRPDSELLGLRSTAGRPTAVSAVLFTALSDALEAARSTDGLVDPTVGRAMAIVGYDRDFGDVAASGPPLVARVAPVPGWRSVRLDPVARTVSVPGGVLLDLGATAKAGCADRAAARAARATGTGVLVSLGGDVAVAGPAPTGGWTVRIADRHDAGPDAPSVTVGIADGGLATSGTAARRWARGGRELHHLLDPATGLPADSCWRTASVAASTCLLANTASTAAMILGAAAPDWLRRRGLHARLVATDGTVTGVGDWPADRLDDPLTAKELVSP